MSYSKLPHYYKTHRKRHGISQTQMARLINKSRQYICDLEKGRGKPTLENVLAYHILFDVEINNLIPKSYVETHQLLTLNIKEKPHLITNKTTLSIIKKRLVKKGLTEISNIKEYEK